MRTSGLIADTALALKPGRGEPLEIDAERLDRLHAALSRLRGRALASAVEEVGLYACWIGTEKRSPTARDRLLDLARAVVAAAD